jgi:hypothetical protein
MDQQILQEQYDKIYSYFKTTTEPFDSLEWDGKTLEVVFNNRVVEVYDKETILSLINNS